MATQTLPISGYLICGNTCVAVHLRWLRSDPLARGVQDARVLLWRQRQAVLLSRSYSRAGLPEAPGFSFCFDFRACQEVFLIAYLFLTPSYCLGVTNL